MEIAETICFAVLYLAVMAWFGRFIAGLARPLPEPDPDYREPGGVYPLPELTIH